jgi:hypothetical protein
MYRYVCKNGVIICIRVYSHMYYLYLADAIDNYSFTAPRQLVLIHICTCKYINAYIYEYICKKGCNYMYLYIFICIYLSGIDNYLSTAPRQFVRYGCSYILISSVYICYMTFSIIIFMYTYIYTYIHTYIHVFFSIGEYRFVFDVS